MQFGDLRGILQYVPQFRGGTFVIAVDGLVAASENLANVLLDIGVLHSLNIKVVLVHGAGHQVREMAAARGVAISNEDGTGVTDTATLELSVDAISRLTNKLMQQLTSIHLRGVTANAITAHPAGVINGVDLGMTGTIDRIDAKGLRSFLEEGMVPVIAPLGHDSKGRALRLNSDAVAVAVGEALGAQKILFLSHDIARDAAGDRIQKLSVTEAEGLVEQAGADGSLGRRLRSILRFAARACAAGVPRVHLLDGMQDEALLGEVFSNEGLGTMVFSDAYDEVRAARAEDVPAIVSMIRQSVKDEELLLRNRTDILERWKSISCSRWMGTRWGRLPCTLSPMRARPNWPACSSAKITRTSAMGAAWWDSLRRWHARAVPNACSRCRPRRALSSVARIRGGGIETAARMRGGRGLPGERAKLAGISRKIAALSQTAGGWQVHRYARMSRTTLASSTPVSRWSRPW